MNELKELCNYLEDINNELNEKILKNKRECLKLQDIYENLSKNEVFDKREDSFFNISKIKINNYKNYNTSDLYGEFLRLNQEFKKLPNLPRERISYPFISRIMDFSRITPSHIFTKMIPCLESFQIYLNNNLNKNKYLINKSNEVLEKYKLIIQENNLFKKVEIFVEEQLKDDIIINNNNINEVDKFETIANLSSKQLNQFYRLRSIARQQQVLSNLNEKISNLILPILNKNYNNIDENEKIQYLTLTTKIFPLLTNSKRSHTIIANK